MRPSVAVTIAQTPRPPYYVAIITVERSEIDDGYFEMADAMYHAASSQDGFLGMEWVSDAAQRVGITASYLERRRVDRALEARGRALGRSEAGEGPVVRRLSRSHRESREGLRMDANTVTAGPAGAVFA